MILVQRHITQAHIYLSFYGLSYLFIHISSISSGCIYISESEKERECYISEHVIYLHYLLVGKSLLCKEGAIRMTKQPGNNQNVYYISLLEYC